MASPVDIARKKFEFRKFLNEVGQFLVFVSCKLCVCTCSSGA